MTIKDSIDYYRDQDSWDKLRVDFGAMSGRRLTKTFWSGRSVLFQLSLKLLNRYDGGERTKDLWDSMHTAIEEYS